MRRFLTASLLGAVVLGSMTAQSDATSFDMSRILKPQIAHISFQTPVLGPFAYTHFCLRYTQDCRIHGRAFRRPHPVDLTREKWQELVSVNNVVNREIIAQPHWGDKTYATWRIAPTHGDCNDYAVTKRHELLARGWPSRALLLAEVVTSWGEHHLVLVVRTRQYDYVVDNLTAQIRKWAETPYEWVRIQSPSDSVLWSTIRSPQA